MEYLWNICGCWWNLFTPLVDGTVSLFHRWHLRIDRFVVWSSSEISPWKPYGSHMEYGSHMDMFHKYGQQLRFGLQRESLVSGWDLRVPSFATDKTIRKLRGMLSGFSGWRQNMEIMNGAVLEQERQTGYRWPPAHCSLMEPCMEACKTMSWKAETRGTVALPSHPLSLSSQDVSSWMTL